MSDVSSSFLANAPFIELSLSGDTPCNELRQLPPVQDVESVAVLKSCIGARTALAALNETCRYFDKPGLLESSLRLLESHSSAALDGQHMPVQELLRNHAFDNQEDPIRKSIVARERATALGLTLTRDRAPGVMTTLEVCSALAGSPVAIRRDGVSPWCATDSGEALYTPPVGAERLQRLLGNWEDFMQVEAANLDPLVVMGIAYYQFLAISPFKEHNGAVSRVLLQLFFNDEGLISLPLLNFSGYFRKHTSLHDRLLADVAYSQNWHEWLLFFVKGAQESAEMALSQVRGISRLIGETDELLQREMPRIYSPELLDALFEKPYCRIQDLVKKDIAKRQTASQYLKRLCQLDVLSEQQQGKEKLFINHKLLNLVAGDGV